MSSNVREYLLMSFASLQEGRGLRHPSRDYRMDLLPFPVASKASRYSALMIPNVFSKFKYSLYGLLF